jgi:hypothetical protein
MKVIKIAVGLLVIGYWVLGFSATALAKDEVGTMVAIRGKAIIERDKKAIEAKVKDSILLKDTVSTMEASKAKMLFIDDSVLTLGEKSKVVIEEFIYTKEKEGRSIFNLLDGKMKSIVGKTKFEVHTPTSVAAARGTVILSETGVIDGRKFTIIICLEGEANIMSADPNIPGSIILTPGMMVIIFEGEPLPTPTPASPSDIERLKDATDISRHEVSVPGPMEIEVGPGGVIIEPVAPPTEQPPVDQQPIPTTPVTIDVIFPE